jgi:hypothetical protein
MENMEPRWIEAWSHLNLNLGKVYDVTQTAAEGHYFLTILTASVNESTGEGTLFRCKDETSYPSSPV